MCEGMGWYMHRHHAHKGQAEQGSSSCQYTKTGIVLMHVYRVMIRSKGKPNKQSKVGQTYRARPHDGHWSPMKCRLTSMSSLRMSSRFVCSSRHRCVFFALDTLSMNRTYKDYASCKAGMAFKGL